MITGTILVIFGFVILLVAGLGYLLSNPQHIRDLKEWITTVRKSTNVLVQVANETKASMSRIPYDAPIEKQFEDLRSGETVEIDLDSVNVLERKERVVTCRGQLCALNRSDRNFTDRGENWPVFILDGTIMLIKRPDGWFWFDKGNAIVLEGESASMFDEAGVTFSEQYDQVPRSYSFKWNGQKLTVLDVGYLRYEQTDGTSHLPNGMMVKYMLAEDTQKNIIYLENVKAGADRVWKMGHALGMTIQQYCGKILRAA